ncbi:MAG: HD domain-containing protein [Methanocellales archaeon]|nr:HD domain-containing protein [Methanocellales archaeon]
MIRKPFILKIFEATDMQRWNDKIRPVELRELDKQAHKMIIAYLLGKFEEENNSENFDWIEIIEGGIFEFLQRLIVTDLKPPIFHKIKEDPEKYKKLNDWVCEEIEHIISPLGNNFYKRFQDYLSNPSENVNKRILSAAHFYATKWEFDVIERANPNGYEISEIKSYLQAKQEKYYDLEGIRQLSLYSKLKNFVDLCGELRFQVRWSHLHRIHETSVLGHMLIVAMLSYLFSLEIGSCRKRRINNYFTGLFHDLPEILTRDIISPVKKDVRDLSPLIKEYEKEEMEKKIYKLIPNEWHSEMRMFTEREFESIVTINGKMEEKTSDQISNYFNEDRYNPRDGEIVKATDSLAAFIETYLELSEGMTSKALKDAKSELIEK